jgi:hypothetical protein
MKIPNTYAIGIGNIIAAAILAVLGIAAARHGQPVLGFLWLVGAAVCVKSGIGPADDDDFPPQNPLLGA